MWNSMGQTAPATTILDFTNDFSLLLIGLISIVGLSSAVIVWMATCHYLSQKRQRVEPTSSVNVEQQDAA